MIQDWQVWLAGGTKLSLIEDDGGTETVILGHELVRYPGLQTAPRNVGVAFSEDSTVELTNDSGPSLTTHYTFTGYLVSS